MSTAFLDAVEAAGVSAEIANAGLVVQCFDLEALKTFAAVQAQRGFDIPLVWLVSCAQGLPNTDLLVTLSKLATYTAVACAPTLPCTCWQ